MLSRSIRIFLTFLSLAAATTVAGLARPRIVNIFSLSLLLICCSGVSNASSLSFWQGVPVNAPGGYQGAHVGSYQQACSTLAQTGGTQYWGYRPDGDNRVYCDLRDAFGSNVYKGYALKVDTNCEFGDSNYYCNASCDTPNTMVNGQCVAPEPPPECPAGAFWDFDTDSCKYPQDDACDSIGASWDPAASACQCDSPTAALVTAAGVSRCMQLRDDSCTKDSSDFKGYATYGDSAGQAICDGRASCPDGGTPGYIGSGDTMSAVCYNNEAEPNAECDGQTGVINGVQVCIPNPGEDPDFPDCSGVVGLVNGVKTCIHKPTEHPGCKSGETAGYVGTGANAQFTCIPSDYKPETCPPGQYITNAETGGFGCATASGQSKEDKDAGKTPGKTSGTASGVTTTKDAAGNVTGTEETEMEIELDLTQLTEDAPANNYKEELDEFSDATLDGLGLDEISSEFSGQSGAFTERSSLDNASGFFQQHTIGNSANCAGSLPFFGYTISCEKFSHFNRIFGWFFFILALWYIYETLTAPSPS